MSSIRHATPADADGVTRVYMQSAEHHAAIDPERYAIPDRGEILKRYREGKQHGGFAEAATFVAIEAGRVDGFVDVRMTRSTDPMHRSFAYCYIAEIAVDAELRRTGVGAKLMRAAEEWGRERGAEFALLEYNAANSGVSDFYDRMGYRTAAILATKRLIPHRTE